MHWYLESTADAVKGLLQIAVLERQKLDALETEFGKLSKKHEFLYKDFRTADLQEDFDELQVQGKFDRAAGAGVEADAARLKTEEFKRNMEARASSHSAVCGAILQIAKQSLSAHFGRSRNNSPPGRTIGSESIRNVIWEGRNQSMHFEVPEQVGPVIRATFNKLESTFGARFHLDPLLHASAILLRK
jgi:hypothetical protein